MGKKSKEHRKKVAKRNEKIKQQKSGMQKAFDLILKQHLDKMKKDDISVKLGDQPIDMSIVEDRIVDTAFKFTPNPEESSKINKEYEENNQQEDNQ
jgi:hypothetical protein